MRRALPYLLCLCLSVYACSALASKKAAPQKRAQPQQLSFEYHEGLIFLKVKINTKPDLMFLLNTGANISVINNTTAEALKMQVMEDDSVEGTAGKEAVKMIRVHSIKAGNALITDLCMTKRDLRKWPSPGRQPIDGILGTDFLSNFIVTIDYRNKKISFQKKTDKKRTAYENNCDFRLSNGIPMMHATLNDSCMIPLRYNSGVSQKNDNAIYINVSMETWRMLKKYDHTLMPKDYFTGSAVGGHVYLPVVKIRKMEISDFLVKEPFIVVQPEEGYFKNKDAIGFFGNNFLEKYETVCLDFQDNKISCKS